MQLQPACGQSLQIWSSSHNYPSLSALPDLLTATICSRVQAVQHYCIRLLSVGTSAPEPSEWSQLLAAHDKHACASASTAFALAKLFMNKDITNGMKT